MEGVNVSMQSTMDEVEDEEEDVKMLDVEINVTICYIAPKTTILMTKMCMFSPPASIHSLI